MRYILRLIVLPTRIFVEFWILLRNISMVESLQIRRAFEEWPEGAHGFKPEIRYRAIVLARICPPPIKNIFLSTDLPETLNVSFNPKRLVPLEKSERFRLAQTLHKREWDFNQVAKESRGYLNHYRTSFEKIKFFVKQTNKEAMSCYVKLKWNGDVVIMDGTHRILAHYIADRTDRIKMYVIV
jgi:hypothetical protein